jgi:uncharacterized protein
LKKLSRKSGEGTTKPRKNRVVIDTGILVSAFGYGGIPAKAVRKAVQAASIFISLELLKEYRDIPPRLLADGDLSIEQYRVLVGGIASIQRISILVLPGQRLALCRDPKDNMLLECCIAARANFLISGDKDLLALHGHEALPGLSILSPRGFIDRT